MNFSSWKIVVVALIATVSGSNLTSTQVVEECLNCTALGWPFARLVHPIHNLENFYCMNNQRVLEPELLIIDMTEKQTECESFPIRALELQTRNDTIRRIENRKEYQLLIEFSRGVSQINGDGCLSPLLGFMCGVTGALLGPNAYHFVRIKFSRGRVAQTLPAV